jgi:hypothetical protein
MTTTVRIPDRLEQTLAQYCVEARRGKAALAEKHGRKHFRRV